MRVETPETALFFAWRGGKGKIGKQRGFKDAKAKWYGNKDADFVTAWSFKKGGCGKYRTVENLDKTSICFSDIDSDLPLAWQDIMAKCVKHNVPKPYLIPETSPNHYQPRWTFSEIDTDLLWMWQEVQDGLYEMLKDIGADPQAKDAVRYLRNPNKCNVVYSNELCKTSLSVLYRSLKIAGFIKDKPKTKWPTKFSPDGIPIKESREKFVKFFTDKPGHESTYADLSKTLSIPLRTVKYLCKQFRQEGKLTTLVLGKGKSRKTKFIFKVHIKEYLNTLPSKESVDSPNVGDFSPGASLGKERKESVFVFSQALVRAKALGFSRGVRNFGFFGLALWLSTSKRMSYDEIFKELFPVLILTPGFSRREYEKCVKSACRDRYRYCISKEKFTPVFISLGLGGAY